MVKRNRIASVAITATKDWDRDIKVGSRVLVKADPFPHVYEVTSCESRFLGEHDLWNFPSLMKKGFEGGYEISPLLVLVRSRLAPSWNRDDGAVFTRKMDAQFVHLLTPADVQAVIDNLNELMAEL